MTRFPVVSGLLAFCFVFSFTLISARPAAAQQATAQVTGTIRDT